MDLRASNCALSHCSRCVGQAKYGQGIPAHDWRGIFDQAVDQPLNVFDSVGTFAHKVCSSQSDELVVAIIPREHAIEFLQRIFIAVLSQTLGCE